MDRDAFVAMIVQTCAETNVWVVPQPLQMSTEEYRQLVDGLAAAGNYFLERHPEA